MQHFSNYEIKIYICIHLRDKYNLIGKHSLQNDMRIIFSTAEKNKTEEKTAYAQCYSVKFTVSPNRIELSHQKLYQSALVKLE